MVAIIIIFGLIAWIDLHPLIREKNWRDVAAFGIVFGLALVVSVLNELKVPIPSTILTADKWMKQIGIHY
jgi:hypothetical protein